MSDFKRYLVRSDVYVAALWGTLCDGLEQFVHGEDYDQVVLGLSGGIDSAVVACMAAEALGPKDVVALGMPSRFSSEDSRTDAEELAGNLGIHFREISIEPVFNRCEEVLGAVYGERLDGIPHENLQARIRGMFLMAHANVRGALVLATGNKSEAAMGYCTLYGDTVGAVAPIGDVLKTDVYALARYANRDAELIPRKILAKAPSAELRLDQKDSDVLPPYEVLDYVLRRYLEDNMAAEDIAFESIGEEQVAWILDTLHETEFKRDQMPPALCVSSAPFGGGPLCVLKI